MIELNSDEARVLGVLIEKDKTTPEQYPLSLNAIVNGANQKNNRDPVMTMSDNQAFDALESLRAKNLVVRMEGPGMRVNKYRHNTQEALRLPAGQIAILAELLLRGPQTLGELRGRASRMHPLDSLDVVKDLLRAMMQREDQPLVRQIPPAPGSRAERYMQLLCPDLHDVNAPAAATQAPGAPPASASLLQRVETLEAELADLKQTVQQLLTALGESNPPTPPLTGA